MQGQYLTRVAHYPTDWFYNPCFLIGIFLFFLGFAINVHSDYILTNLRKPGETGYKIPRGTVLYCKKMSLFNIIIMTNVVSIKIGAF